MKIGKIKTVLSSVPWICLSATLTSNVATYIHRVLRLKKFMMRLECSIRRDNINILRIRLEGDGIDQSDTGTPPLRNR